MYNEGRYDCVVLLEAENKTYNKKWTGRHIGGCIMYSSTITKLGIFFLFSIIRNSSRGMIWV